MTDLFDAIVIGGGAAGLMASLTAAENGRNVLLLEKNEKFGRKLAITGKGRCNVTNDCPTNELILNIPQNPKFLYSAFNAFSTQHTKDFFESCGVPLKTERGKRVFPVSDKAQDIVNALVERAKLAGVCFLQGTAKEILTENGVVTGVKLTSGKVLSAPSVLIATGGLSYPVTGSTGDGYRMAESLGHTVTELSPSLIPVIIKEDDPKEMQGLSLKNVTLTVTKDKKEIFSELGEMLLTHFGVSGPLVLSASAHMRDKTLPYMMHIDMKPGLTEEQLDRRLLRDFSENLNRDIINSLGALLPRKMIPVMLRRAQIPFETKVNEITREQRRRLLESIKRFSLTPIGFRPVAEAIITSGGVSVKEVNPRTMESKLVPGLFFAGEVLDVDGYTGGFNLQIAFSTAVLAGRNL